MYPQSVSTCLGWVTAFAASQVHQVDPAGDAVVMFLTLHKLCLQTQIHTNNLITRVWFNTTAQTNERVSEH